MPAPHGISDDPIAQNYVNDQGQPRLRWYTGWPSPPWAIVLHYSAGYTWENCKGTLEDRGLSVHFTLDRDGVLHRHVPDTDRAIHAGYGQWAGRSNMNHAAYGVEIVSFGVCDGSFPSDDAPAAVFDLKRDKPHDPQERQPHPFLTWYRTWVGGDGQPWAVITRQPAAAFPDHRPDYQASLWTTYTREQIEAISWQVWQWVYAHRILIENVVGHEHVTPHRKIDPGPAFPWRDLQNYLLERAAEYAPGLVDQSERQDERIKAVQSHLRRLGLYGYAVDGLWGKGTQAGADEALELYGELYGFDYQADPDHCLDVCLGLVLVPGFDPAKVGDAR